MSTLHDVNALFKLAKLWHQSGLLPKHYKSAQQVLTVAMMADELGVARLTALRNMFVVGGVPACNARLLLGLAQRSPDFAGMDMSDDGETCTVTLSRRLRNSEGMQSISKVSASFSMADAKAAGLLNKDNWRNYPQDMRFAKAASRAVNRLFADRTLGLMTFADMSVPMREVGGELVIDSHAVEVENLVPEPIEGETVRDEVTKEDRDLPTDAQVEAIAALLSMKDVFSKAEIKKYGDIVVKHKTREIYEEVIDQLSHLKSERSAKMEAPAGELPL